MVARIPSTRKRILHELHIGKIAAVDRPCQEHARMTLMKRASPDIEKDYGDYPSPATVSQEVQAVDFDTVLAEQEAREAACEVGDELREKWCALQRSFATIAADESVSAADKITQMQASLQQYVDSLSEQSDEIAESMTKSLTTAAPALAELLAKNSNSEGDEDMPDDTKKQLADLQKTVAALTSKLEAATASDSAKKAADLQGELDAAKAQLAEATKKVEEVAKQAEAEKAELVAKAGMSDGEKAYMDGLEDPAAKKAFMALSPADRKAKMKKSADEDPVVYKSADGTEFRKSDDPRMISMAKRADENEKLAKSEVEKRETAELTKRADEILKDYAGEDADKVEALRAVSKVADEKVRKTLETMLEAGGKAMKAAFETIGHDREKVTKASQDFDKRVSEVAARDKISKSEAMSKARQEFPEEFKAYQGAGTSAN